jgi:iron complex outermembrane recepter protein
MTKSRIAPQTRRRKPGAPAHSERSQRSCRLASLARLAPLFACAGVLTTSVPAAAQTQPAPAPAAPPAPAPEAPPAPAPETPPAPAPEAPPAPAPEAPPAPAPEAPPAPDAPPAPEASAAAPAPAAEGSPAASPAEEATAEPLPEDTGEPLPEDVEEGELAEVVVTGFRSSLSAALLRKQRSTGQIDAIVADDIADFPDLNLAESLQRIPGVSINRVNGEGSQITVRGLSSLYTRVRVNGMEARAAVGNSNNDTSGRTFDFNLFASELFNSIVVHKTASADLDEGSLGAVVDLNTARAFNYKEGFTFLAGATGSYNDLSDTLRPRLTGLIAYRDPAGIWGATASAAYTRVRLDAVSVDTVQWQRGAPFRSVNGVVCATVPTDPDCLGVEDAFHPRIPRYGQDVTTGDRLGLTAGVQFRPTPLTEIRLDALYATYPNTTEQRRLFPLIRGNEATTDISNYTLTPFPDRFGVGNDSVIAGDLNAAWIRSEHVRIESLARFHQVGLAIDQQITDRFRADAFAGFSQSTSGRPHDTTINYDNRIYDGYRFDFTNDKAPILAFNGLDVTDPATFVVPELRDRVSEVKSGFSTLELNLNYDFFDQLKLAAGANYKRATLDTTASSRDGLVCALGLYDCDTDDDGVEDVLGPPGDPALTEQFRYPGETGAGSTTRWASPTIDGWVDFFDYYNAPLTLNQGGTNKVTENNLGYYLQARGEVLLGLGDMRLMYDAGVRLVETRQTSSGYASGVWVTVDRPTYRDWLPSANTALWLTEELVLRLAAAKVMSRPSLNDLSPGGTVESFQYLVQFQNPRLNPTRALALDAAAEWYFGDGSLLSLAVFYKDLESFPIRQSRIGTFASTGLPRDVIQPLSPADQSGPAAEGTCADPVGCWNISELTNGPGSTVKGLELGFQAPFRVFYGALPVVIRDMGIVANYTYVDSSADYDFFGNPVRERLIGLSNGSYNATLYYDDSRFNARVSLAYRSDYLVGGPNSQGNLWTYNEAETRVDFSSGYNVNEHLKISLEALNLTDTAFSQRADVDAQRRGLYNKYGRTFLLGARVTY